MIRILSIIIGRSGTGKTTYLKEILKEKIKKGEKRIIYLVPEPSSFETERDLLNFLGEKWFSFVNVLTFGRMNDFIFRNAGYRFSNKITDGVRNIFMSLAMEKSDKNLKLYKKTSDNIDMIKMMINTLGEMKTCTVSTFDIKKCIENLKEGTLKQKIKEIAEIFENYQKIMDKNLYDSFDDLNFIFGALKDTKILENYIVFIDSFHDFDQQRMNVLEEILKQSKDSFFTFCTDENFKSNLGLTSHVNKIVNKIMDFAEKNSIEMSEIKILDTAKRFKNEELKVLERNFFKSPKEIYKNKPENITLYSASDIYDECEFIASTIKSMVVEKGYRYRNFAIATMDIEAYNEKISSIFKKYNIPYFIDSPKNIEESTLFCLVFAAFDIAISNFESGNVFRYLKTGLAGLSTDEISFLENYVFLWDINKEGWKKPFNMPIKGFCKEVSETEKKEIQKIEKIRVKLIDPLVKFQNKVLYSSADEISKALYELLEDIKASENIREFCGNLVQLGDLSSAEEQSRIWDILVNSLDQMFCSMKEVNVTPRRYKELLKLLVQSDNISFIPEGLDEVLVSSVNKRELMEYKVVFVIGAVDGKFPSVPVSSGILNDTEREELRFLGINLYDGFEKMYNMQEFLSYLAVTSASDKLFVTWPSSSLTGSINFSSEIVKQIKSIFPKVNVLDRCSLKSDYFLWSMESAFEFCVKNFTKENFLKQYFMNKENYKSKIEAINRIVEKKELHVLDKTISKSLFGDSIKVSASQIEKFYMCSFQYFCRYGLKAKERKKARFDPLEYGSFIHFVFEKILKGKSKEEFLGINKDDIQKEIENLMQEYLDNYFVGFAGKSSRFKYLFLRCKKVILDLIIRLSREFSQSLFSPVDCELNISEKGEISPLVLNLSCGGQVKVEGKVDRVDIMDLSGKRFLRIVDYKTGNKKFRLCDILSGLNMQMFLYLAAITANGEKRYGKFMPAGVLYMPSFRPSVVAETISEDKSLPSKVEKSLRMSGIILSDTRVVQGMEEKLKGEFVPASIKNEILSGEENLASEHQIDMITKYIQIMVKNMARKLKEGEFFIDPIQDEKKRACDMCFYGSICGFEDKQCTRIMQRMKKDQVMEEIERKVKEGRL